MKGPRFSEEMFPIKEIGEISSREKSIRHGHISTMHVWWARRPLAISRAINYASFIPMPFKIEEIQKKKDFMIRLSKWENSLDHTMLEKAAEDILTANFGKRPKILDPFAGGGSIPLESIRLGCETYASDYNPVAVLLLKCTLEYPQEYGTRKQQNMVGLKTQEKNQLREDVEFWGHWVLREAKSELSKYYTQDSEIPVGYIWTKTIPCQNPSCNAKIPLMRQYWLAKKNDKKISLYPYTAERHVKFKLVGTGFDKIPKDFDPTKGSVSNGIATCLVCGSVVDNDTIARLFREGKSGQEMLAVVFVSEGIKGKKYRMSSNLDKLEFEQADKRLHLKRNQLMESLGVDPIPDEPLPPPGTLQFRLRRYNVTTWGELFNSRQKLSLMVFTEKIRWAHTEMIRKEYDQEYAKAVTSYLALCLDRLATYNSINAPWHVTGEKATGIFGRVAMPMVWDYAEINPLGQSFSWITQLEWILKTIEHLCQIPKKGKVFIDDHSATELPYPNEYFDAVFTDPPYYDNIAYSHLSDFFYVLLKRTVGHLYPELFSTPLTPKSKEIVAYSNIAGGFQAGKKFFEDMLKKSFQEISRVLKTDGISVIVYAHKSTAGWETLINSLLDSGLVVTAAWPINTEMKERLRASETASLASSIYMVAGKYKKKNIGFYRDVRKDLKTHLNNELDKLWNEGISGADFLVAGIGSAIEVFGMYEKIIDDEGNEIRADKLLEQIRRIVTDYAVRQVLHNGFASEISQLTRFYLLWRWAYGESKIVFDDARKLAQSVGLDLADSWNKGFIQKDKEFIRILGPHDRIVDELIDSNELIDILHMVLLLWNSGKADKVLDVLQQSGLGRNDNFYRIAQAVSESLPNESKEKKWLEGFLAGKARISKQIKVKSGQRRLFE